MIQLSRADSSFTKAGGSPKLNTEQLDEEYQLSLSKIRRQPSSNEGRESFYQLDRIGKHPVSYFAKRDELSQIMDLFKRAPHRPEEEKVTAISLVGLGGSGKTQLMLQYASRFREFYGVVLWFDARSEEALEESFELAAAQLGLILPATTRTSANSSGAMVEHQPSRVLNAALVKKELRRRNQLWLLLFDEADDLHTIDFLPRYFPSDSNGDILISSRQKEAYRITRYSLNVAGLPTASARDLLLHHARLPTVTSKQLLQAEEVVESLDCIALAIDLAGTYVFFL